MEGVSGYLGQITAQVMETLELDSIRVPTWLQSMPEVDSSLASIYKKKAPPLQLLFRPLYTPGLVLYRLIVMTQGLKLPHPPESQKHRLINFAISAYLCIHCPPVMSKVSLTRRHPAKSPH